jgi:ribosome modulation factor
MPFKQATPYDQGYQAGVLRRAPESNPFKKGSREAAQWDKGHVRGTKLMYDLKPAKVDEYAD